MDDSARIRVLHSDVHTSGRRIGNSPQNGAAILGVVAGDDVQYSSVGANAAVEITRESVRPVDRKMDPTFQVPGSCFRPSTV